MKGADTTEALRANLLHVCDGSWRIIDGVGHDDLLALASALGKAIPTRTGGPLVDVLNPRASSRCPSQTATHGMGSFPLHVDGAHRLIPPRWLLLLGVEPSRRPTLVVERSKLHLEREEIELLKRGTVLVKNGRRSFLTTLLDGGQRFLRFDPCCMQPASRSGKEAWRILSARLNGVRPIELVLRAGQLLLLDNWACVHGRGPGTDDHTRTLFRVTVEAHE